MQIDLHVLNNTRVMKMNQETIRTRFTDRVCKVMKLAIQEAERLNHRCVGTEHILLGLVKEGSGVAAMALRKLDVDLHKIRVEVEKLLPTADSRMSQGELPHRPDVEKVIGYSVDEALNLGHSYIGTEHLILGLLHEQDGPAFQVFASLGVKPDDVRGEVLELLGHNRKDPVTELEVGSSLTRRVAGLRMALPTNFSMPVRFGTGPVADEYRRCLPAEVKLGVGRLDKITPDGKTFEQIASDGGMSPSEILELVEGTGIRDLNMVEIIDGFREHGLLPVRNSVELLMFGLETVPPNIIDIGRLIDPQTDDKDLRIDTRVRVLAHICGRRIAARSLYQPADFEVEARKALPEGPIEYLDGNLVLRYPRRGIIVPFDDLSLVERLDIALQYAARAGRDKCFTINQRVWASFSTGLQEKVTNQSRNEIWLIVQAIAVASEYR